MEGVQWCILEYFKQLFTSSRPLDDDIQRGVEHLTAVVDGRMAEDLQRSYTVDKSAFVLGRLITDNVLLAFEINHFLNTHSKGGKQFMNLKLDISKGYDRVEWSFLRRVLESLSSLFRSAAESGSVPKVALCRGAPSISHLLFADDTMVFCPATQNTVQQICTILDSYARASGQHELYLGLPATAFRSKRTLFASLKDRIWQRIHRWQEQSLSQAKKDFFWHDGDCRRIYWLAWEKMCPSKFDGEMGFQNLEAFNLALLAKQLWRILIRPECLSLLAAKELVRAGCVFSVHSAYHLALSMAAPASSSSRKRNLRRRLPQTPLSCPFCGSEAETAIHAFSNALLLVKFGRSRTSNGRALYSVDCYGHQSVQVRWSSPCPGWIKINFDGAVLDGGSALGVGVLARDPDGTCLAWQSTHFEWPGAAIVAEAYAAREAIQLAWHRGWRSVVLKETASHLLTTCLLSIRIVRWSVLLCRIFDLLLVV
ncbi:UNVERIFIED_CONTAM: hypothetical protein Slati_0550000 [Sesamum latifolium]|uniref:RNase H type-1 domain-containing protein n=1 Tax=Sesamum latifolium TaxID=2727402 RepID=A0AAW2XZG4_9LAMI